MRIAAGAVVSLLASVAGGQSFVNWETPHVHPMDMTPDGTRLLAVNTADNRLEIFTVTPWGLVPAAAVPVGLDPVSVRARNNTEAWVVNHVSDSVSIVDLVTLRVVTTFHPGDEPADVVFAGNPQRAFVSVSQENEIAVYDPDNTSGALAILGIEGEDPRELATDGTNVYAAIFESGNRTTVIFHEVVSGPLNPYPGDPNPPPNSGTVFDPPFNGDLPPPPEVALIVKKDSAGVWRDDNGANWSPAVTWGVHDHDVAIINADTLAVSYATGTMNLNMALSVRPGGPVTVVGTDAINHVRFEPKVKGIFVRVMGATVSGAGPAASVIDLNPHLDYSVATVDQATRDLSIGDPRGIAWRAAGDRAYVTGMGSNNLVVVDSSLARVGLVEVGQGPTGVVVNNAQGRVYVLNKFEGSISIVDGQGLVELDRVTYHDPTSAEIIVGRPHLYDTHKTSGLGQASCASCHVDGRMDQIAWDLGNPAGLEKAFNQDCGNDSCGGPCCEDWHPMKGPLMTQTFQGIIGTEPLHWRGDRENLAAFNGAFIGLMGDVPLTGAEMAEFEDFVATITYPPNPFRTTTNALPNSNLANGGNPLAGLVSFNTRGCQTCHPQPDGTDGRIAFNAGLNLPQSIKMPQLRNQYEKTGFSGTSMNNNRGFGFLSDGSIPSLMDFIEFAFNFPAQEELDTEAYMLAFSTDTHAGVGIQVTLPDGESSPAATVSEMIAVAGSGAVGMVAHGVVAGEHRGYYLTGGVFQSDRAGETVSPAVLQGAAASGSEVTFTLVPAGSQVRMGVDRDLDGVLDGNENDAGSNPANPLSLPGNVPVAGGDLGTVVQGDPLVIGVLGNDSDPNGTVDPETIAITVAPAHGTVTSIDPVTGEVTYEHDGSPNATDSFTYRVRDNHGGWSNPAVVQLSVVNELLVDMALAGVTGSVSRCIHFEVFDCEGSSQAFTSQIDFTAGTAGDIRFELPIGDYGCVTAVDPLHSLVRSITFEPGDSIHYAADMTGPAGSIVLGNANGDEFIDILDYGLFSGEWMASYPPSDCTTAPTEADFSGDGSVYTEDFTFLAINFLRENDPSCCPTSAKPGEPVVAISVVDIAGHGFGHMADADLNHDGWIDVADMMAFANGERPRMPGGLGGRSVPVAAGSGGASGGGSVGGGGAAARLLAGGEVEVAGGTFQHADGDLVIGRGVDESSLRLVAGARGTVAGDAIVGTHRSGLGAIEVAGSELGVGGALRVGHGGEGWLEISGGGEVTSALGIVGGLAGGHGIVVVSGTGSAWRILGALEIGAAGSGDLWVVDAGRVEAPEVRIGEAGSLAGDGRVVGTIVNSGTLRPGDGLGTLVIEGEYRQLPAGTLEVEIGAHAPGHDGLQVTGIAALSGLLALTVEDGCVPRPGVELPVVSARQVRGRFSGVVVSGATPAGHWVARYSDDTVAIRFVPATPAR